MKGFILLWLLFPFILSAQTTNYYVNDDLTNNDVFCTTNGNDLLDGLTPASPKRTMTNLIRTYGLSGGDIVYVDTGIYPEQVILTNLDSGYLNNYLLFIGAGVSNETSLVTGNGATGLSNGCFTLTATEWIKLTGFKCKAYTSRPYYAFYIKRNSQHITVSNNSCVSNGWGGIRFELNTRHSLIIDNYIAHNHFVDNNGWGIVIHGSHSNRIENNRVYTNNDFGISLEGGSTYNIITNNKVIYHRKSGTGYGILLNPNQGPTFHNYILNNYCNLNNFNIYADLCYSTVFQSNTILEAVTCGMFLVNECSDCLIQDNYFFRGAQNTSGWGNVIVKKRCHDITIRNNIFRNGQSQGGLRFEGYDVGPATNASFRLLIENNKFINNRLGGIIADYWHTGTLNITCSTLRNNQFYSNGSYQGLIFLRSHSNVIMSNEFYRNSAGIYLEDCTNNDLIGNRCYLNSYGIQLQDTSRNTLFGNQCYQNTYGVYMAVCTFCTVYRCLAYNNTSTGFYLNNLDNSLILNNTAYNNTGLGIYLLNDADNNMIRNCLVIRNDSYGLYITTSSCDNNTIRYNDVYGNYGNYTNSSTVSGGGNYQYVSAGTGSIIPSMYPVFASTNASDSNFLFLSNMSPLIDRGDPADYDDPFRQGKAIDMGAYESPYHASLRISKQASALLDNNSSEPIPGATVNYSVYYDNDGSGACSQVIIYDYFLRDNMTFRSNSMNTNNIHVNGKIQIECYGSGSWQSLTWANNNADLVEGFRWTFSDYNVVGPHNNSGGDTTNTCDGAFPDSDAGVITYQVYIK